jgi:hypothetical protein
MKRRYQIEEQRAVNEFRQLAAKENPAVQMMLPMAEFVGLLQQGVGHLLREAGLALTNLDKMMRGLSTRNYGAVVKEFSNAYGIEKSTVSENFIQASREKVKQLMERPLGELRLCRQPDPKQPEQ